ncbi:hypothetical protein HMPREF0578_0510 [Mobiluncus mulieris 28-1]|nr:hypothetical protein HMPREF0578_0510 [Mobiluncus mulieris 28-1]
MHHLRLALDSLDLVPEKISVQIVVFQFCVSTSSCYLPGIQENNLFCYTD